MFRSEIGSGFEDPGGTPPPRIPRSTPPPPPRVSGLLDFVGNSIELTGPIFCTSVKYFKLPFINNTLVTVHHKKERSGNTMQEKRGAFV